MCLKITDTLIFIERMLFKVDSGAIDMSGCNADAFFDIFFTDYNEVNTLAAVVKVYLIACFILLAIFKFRESVFLSVFYGIVNRFTFGLCKIEEFFVTLGVIENSLFVNLIIF